MVPGQGPAFHDKAYLELTGDLFDSIISQVHAALERGLVPCSPPAATRMTGRGCNS